MYCYQIIIMQCYKTICSCLFLISCSVSAYAQNETQEKFSQFSISLQPEYNRQQQTISLQHFEAAYGWSRHKSQMFEVGLNNIAAYTQENYWHNYDRLKIPTRNIKRSLELNAAHYHYLKGADAHLQPYLVTGWTMLLENLKNIPGTSTFIIRFIKRY